jgi:hypothetical protein
LRISGIKEESENESIDETPKMEAQSAEKKAEHQE